MPDVVSIRTPAGPMDGDAFDALGRGVFFIIGTGRCGSTLLQSMLMMLPGVGIPPELHFFGRFDPALSVGDPIPAGAESRYLAWCRSDPWWSELGVDEAGLTAAIGAGARSARAVFLWLGASLAPTSAPLRRLGEKTPVNERSVPRVLEVFPDAKLIHIHRDPRDVVVSLRKTPWMGHRSVQGSARYCRAVLERQVETARRLGPERHLTLGYERLVASPEAELQRVCSFLGETYDEAMLRYHERRDTGFVAAEAGWKDLTLKPLDQSRTGRWRDALSDHEVATIERSVGPMLEAYGYARSGVADTLGWRAQDLLERGGWWGARQARSVGKRLRLVRPSRPSARE